MRKSILALMVLFLGAADARALTTAALLDTVQYSAFQFFWDEANPSNGLIRDRNQPWSPSSIASVGFGLSSICVAIDHGWVTREAGRDRVLTTLQTFWTAPQGSGATGTIGYKGLYYHFLDMNTATRAWDCELSTIDTALLFAGILDCKQYFTEVDPVEDQIRALADSIYYRADWEFARNGASGIYMGWKPGTGFSGYGLWRGYNEAMILYILALGSPTHPVPETTWNYWMSGYQWTTQYGQTYLIFPPLFGHQYSHCWIDFRHIQDAFMQVRGIDYFENSRRATLAQQAYCAANPLGHTGYSDTLWGLTACDGPPGLGYKARGAPPAQNDDGTIAPTAPLGSIAFAPEIVLPTVHNMWDNYRADLWGPYGFLDAFNLDYGWWDTDNIGIDQGPIVLMIENYGWGSVWERFMQNPDIQVGLQRAGFVQASTDVEPAPAPASRALLVWSAPDPFRQATTVRFRLPQAGPARLAVYDLAGREVVRLLDGMRSAGEHSVDWQAGGVPSGVYYVRLEAGGQVATKRCVRLQ
jgi:hypothetical protein